MRPEPLEAPRPARPDLTPGETWDGISRREALRRLLRADRRDRARARLRARRQVQRRAQWQAVVAWVRDRGSALRSLVGRAGPPSLTRAAVISRSRAGDLS